MSGSLKIYVLIHIHIHIHYIMLICQGVMHSTYDVISMLTHSLYTCVLCVCIMRAQELEASATRVNDRSC